MTPPIIKLKRSAVAGKRPTLANLPLGEIALNTYDGRIFVKQDTGGAGIGTTVTLVNPWSENFLSEGENSIYYDGGDVGIGTQNPTSKLHVNGTVSIEGNLNVVGVSTFDNVSIDETLSLSGLVKETVTSSATAATGTINFDVLTQQNLFFTSNATADWTINFRGNGSNTLNNTLSNNEMITVTHMVTVGTSEYRNSTVQVDGTGTGVTVNWLGGSAPVEGIVSSVNFYTYSILKTAASTYTIFANVTQYG